MIIDSIETVNKYLRTNSTLQLESIQPFIQDAIDQYLKPYAGEQLVNDVSAYASDEQPSNEFLALSENNQNVLLWHSQAIVSRFAFFLGAPSLDLQITESGFAVTSNNILAPASKDRVQNFINSIEKLGWTSIEMFLKFLDEHKASLSAYHEVYPITAYGNEYDLFVNSALDFDKYFKIEKSRLFFQKVQPVIQTAEQLYIEPALSVDLCETFKQEVKDGSILPRTRAILPLIKKAVIYFTVSEDLYSFFPKIMLEHTYTELWKAFVYDEKKKYMELGKMYISLAKNYILDHKDDYPEFVTSSVYEDVTGRINIYENNETDKFYTFQ